MKSIFTSLLLSLTTIGHNGVQDEIKNSASTMKCSPTTELQTEIIKNAKEKVIFRGLSNDETSAVAITFNNSSKEWTVIVYDKIEACIVAHGADGNTTNDFQTFTLINSN